MTRGGSPWLVPSGALGNNRWGGPCDWASLKRAAVWGTALQSFQEEATGHSGASPGKQRILLSMLQSVAAPAKYAFLWEIWQENLLGDFLHRFPSFCCLGLCVVCLPRWTR